MINHSFLRLLVESYFAFSTEGEPAPSSAPAVSPKPTTKPAKPTSLDNSSPHIHITPTASSTHKAKSSDTPRLPTPDYEHKPFTPQPPPSKNKPLPATPQPSESKRTALPSQDTKKPAPSPPAKENKKHLPSESTAQVEDKIDALYKELLPKVSNEMCHLYEGGFHISLGLNVIYTVKKIEMPVPQVIQLWGGVK